MEQRGQMMQTKFKNRKGPAPGEKKCFALNTSGGYISGGILREPNLSIRAFALVPVRARKAQGL